ncbi:uncharacterized protein LOC141538055 [Cotesia typhae]|uniref:uncharacterized protein LOC141530951 n=1 Tax=Cotesia typhae TaxID=2053667 RepID=UPI003D6960D7
MANNFNEFIDKGHIYRLGEENKFYCAYAVMDRICQVTASITASGLILVYGQHDHEPLFTHFQYRVDALVAELKEKSMRNMFNSLKLLKDEMISCTFLINHVPRS